MKLKKLFWAIELFVVLATFAGCGSLTVPELRNVTVPDIKKVDAETAKNILVNNSLIPIVEEVYSNIERDHVVDTIPAIGTQVEKNEKVIIQISKGSWRAESALSTITWWNISGNADTWEFVKPYIQENVLYIECKPTFGTAGKWVDDNDTGKIIGNVTINDKYTCTVTAAYSQKEWNAKDTQSFTLKIPLEEFTEERPIHLDISLFANVNKKFKEVNVEFNIAW